MKKIFYNFSFIIFVFGISSCSEKIDCPPMENDFNWNYAFNELESIADKSGLFNNELVSGQTIEINFVKHNGRWFTIVTSKRSDSVGFSRFHVGFVCRKTIYYSEIHDGFPAKMRGDNLARYNHLLESDSLWTIFGDYAYWSDSTTMKKLFLSTIENSTIISFPLKDSSEILYYYIQDTLK